MIINLVQATLLSRHLLTTHKSFLQKHPYKTLIEKKKEEKTFDSRKAREHEIRFR